MLQRNDELLKHLNVYKVFLMCYLLTARKLYFENNTDPLRIDYTSLQIDIPGLGKELYFL